MMTELQYNQEPHLLFYNKNYIQCFAHISVLGETIIPDGVKFTNQTFLAFGPWKFYK